MTIETLISNQQLIAQQLATFSTSALGGLLGVNSEFSPTLGPPGEVMVVPPELNLDDIPPFSGREITLPTLPTQGFLTDVPIPTLPTFPEDNTPDQPDFTLPAKPAELAAFNGTIPTLEAIPDIADLDVNSMLAAIVLPSLTPIVIEDAPTITLPEFSATKPDGPPTAPTNLQGTLATAYGTALNIMGNTSVAHADAWFARWFPNHATGLTALESRLGTYLAGGTGVDTAVATAIHEIARSKLIPEYIRVSRVARLDAGKRGFDLPDDVVQLADQNARTAMADANANTSNELRKLLFELEQKNLQFAVDQSRQWRTSSIAAYQGMFGSFVMLNGQAIDYAKSVVQAIVDTFNASINGFRAAIEGYKAEAEIYAEKIKVELAKLEVYKSQLEAEKAKAQVNEQLVRTFEARIRSVEAAANVYAKRVEALIAKAGLQKLKFEVFDAQTRAFVAIANAKEGEWRGYVADINGQTALQQSWAETVKARAVELEGYRAHVMALAEQTKVLLAYNESVTRQFEAAIRAYSVQAETEIAIVGSDIESYKAEIAGLAASNQGKGEVARLQLEEWKTGRELVLKKSDQEIVRAKAEAEVKIANLKLQIEVAAKIAEQLSRMAQAALSGINGVLAKTVSSTE